MSVVVDDVSSVRENRPVKAHTKGRVCKHPECSTRLSIYNERDTCSLHAEPEHVPLKRRS